MSGIIPKAAGTKACSCWAPGAGRQPQLCSVHQHLRHEHRLFGAPKPMVLPSRLKAR